MGGTKAGGLKAAATNKLRYGKDFYVKIGSKGGRVTGIPKGFALDRELARRAGIKGGKANRRGKSGESKDNEGRTQQSI